jgi:acetyltransferase
LPKGKRFAVVTNAGRPGIKATDAAARRGLRLVTLRPETNGSVKAKLPPTANIFPVEAT